MNNFLIDISSNNYGFNLSNFIVLILLNIGLLVILVEGSMRNIIGLMIIGFSINIYIINIGYILLPLLLLISIVSISIILYIIRYNNSNVYRTSGYNVVSLVILLIIDILSISKNVDIKDIYSTFGSCMTLSGYNKINNIELIGMYSIFESNILLFVLILVMFLFVIIMIKFSNRIIISYNINYIYFNVMNYVIMNIFILFAIAVLICYIPIIIRYKSKIYKWSSDIYEVGVGVNQSNSLYHSVSNNNIGNYLIYNYIYLFLFLDIIINIIIIGFFLNNYLLFLSFALLFIALNLLFV